MARAAQGGATAAARESGSGCCHFFVTFAAGSRVPQGRRAQPRVWKSAMRDGFVRDAWSAEQLLGRFSCGGVKSREAVGRPSPLWGLLELSPLGFRAGGEAPASRALGARLETRSRCSRELWGSFGGLPQGRGWPGAEVCPQARSDRVRDPLGRDPLLPGAWRILLSRMRERGDAEEGKAVPRRSCRAGRELLVVAGTCPGGGTHTSLTL